jgi:uncharacterized metal-binding protein YceD (DUF177 family)
MTEKLTEFPWSALKRLNEVPESGLHVTLAAPPEMLAALAKPAGVDAVERLVAEFDLIPRGRGLHVGGRVTATVRQTCGVTLEPFLNAIDEAVDDDFAPPRTEKDRAKDEGDGDEETEPLTGDSIDLGVLATEYLILGVDPYPRKPDAAFAPPATGEAAAHPFAALSGWNKKDAVKE